MKNHIGILHKYRSCKGSAIIEAMISILIFSVGMIGLLGMQASAIKQAGDAKFRADAAYLANQLVGKIWADRANIASYAYRQNVTSCTAGGGTPPYAPLANWITELAATLPGTSTRSPSVTVDATTNTVTILICWAQPADVTAHSFVSTTQIN